MSNKLATLLMALLAVCWLTACSPQSGPTPTASNDHGHEHGEGADHQHEEEAHDHAHEEIALGTYDIGGISLEAAQGHGNVDAGKEGHLVIKLSYTDKGATIVRAWLGTEDRTLSAAGKGEYAPSHDDYDIHAIAPNPLPEGCKWWVEIEKPDGSKVVGSIPLLRDVQKK